MPLACASDMSFSLAFVWSATIVLCHLLTSADVGEESTSLQWKLIIDCTTSRRYKTEPEKFVGEARERGREGVAAAQRRSPRCRAFPPALTPGGAPSSPTEIHRLKISYHLIHGVESDDYSEQAGRAQV